jgi:hypothetical protein
MKLKGVALVEDYSPTCCACGSTDVGTAGANLKPSVDGLVMRYRCRRCGTTFSATSWSGKHAPRAAVELAIETLREGGSLEDAVNALFFVADVQVSEFTVANWAQELAPDVYREEHREEISAKQARYYEEHREEISAKQARYYEEHREEISAKQARYREEHREEISAKQARYREEHREEISAKKARYYEEHREEISAKKARYYEEHREEISAKKARYYEEHLRN